MRWVVMLACGFWLTAIAAPAAVGGARGAAAARTAHLLSLTYGRQSSGGHWITGIRVDVFDLRGQVTRVIARRMTRSGVAWTVSARAACGAGGRQNGEPSVFLLRKHLPAGHYRLRVSLTSSSCEQPPARWRTVTTTTRRLSVG